MSGFLQRLAGGVLHPQRAIHPSMGTIWLASGTVGRGTGAPGVEEAIESANEVLAPSSPRRADASQPPAAQPPETQLAPRIPRMQPEPGSESEDYRHAGHPAIDEDAAFQPLVASPEQRAVFTPLPHTDAAAPPGEAILPQDPRRASPEGTGSQHPQSVESVGPLVPSPRMPVSAMAAARKAPPFLQTSQRHAQPAQSQAEERDAIEIHIGRIEVVAAPPRPAQPAAPRPARKSLDLGEYLRRERRPR